MTDEELQTIRADLAVPLNPMPLHEILGIAYAEHYAREGLAAEHLAVEVDERDLDDWIDQAALNHARGMALRGQVAALLGEVGRLREEVGFLKGVMRAVADTMEASGDEEEDEPVRVAGGFYVDANCQPIPRSEVEKG